MSISIQPLGGAISPDLASRAAARPAPENAQQARPEAPLPARKEVETAITKVQEFVGNQVSELNFSIDEDSGMQIVKVIDSTSNEVIRQIPSQEVVEMAKALERLQGLLLRQKA